MIRNEPVVAVVGGVVTMLTVLSVGVVDDVIVAEVGVEAVGVVPVVGTGVVTVDSAAVVNDVRVTVLSAKHTQLLTKSLILVGNELYLHYRTVTFESE